MGKEPDEESSVEAEATTQAGAGAHTGRAGGSERTAPGKALGAGPTGPDGQAGRKPAQAELAGAESAGGGRATGRGARTAPQRARGGGTLLGAGGGGRAAGGGARTAPQRARGVATLLEAGAETLPDLMCSIARSLCVLG